MNVIRCKNGHFFDGDAYNTCPHCGENPMTSSNENFAKEEKKGFFGKGKKEKKQFDSDTLLITPDINLDNNSVNVDIPTEYMGIKYASEPIQEEEKEPQIEKPTVSLKEVVKNASADKDGKTLSYFSSAIGIASNKGETEKFVEPVVGWLVCVGGINFGKCFCIFDGKNSIGRSDSNRVVIAGDNRISQNKHASIIYEPKKGNYYLQPGDSSGLTYLNDEYIAESNQLNSYDKIELGDSKFIFIPLCGEKFSWEEYVQKENNSL